jgi:hypothetical protein
MQQNGSAAQLDPAEFMYVTDYKQVNKKISVPAIPQLSWGIVQGGDSGEADQHSALMPINVPG